MSIIFSTLLCLFILARSFRFGVMNPYFLFFLHFFLAVPIRALVLTFHPDYYKIVLHPIVSINIGSILTLTAFAFVVFVSVETLMHYKKKRARHFTTKIGFKAFNLPVNVSLTFFYSILFIYFICLFSYFLLMISAAGSFQAVLQIFSMRVSSKLQGLHYLSLISDYAILTSLYLFAIQKFSPNVRKKSLAVRLVVLISFSMLIIQGGRGNIIMYIISLSLINMASKNSIKIGLKKLVMIMLLVFSIAVLGLTSRVASQQDISMQAAFARVAGNLVSTLSAPFAIYDHFILSERYSEKVGHDYGMFYLENFTRPVPRAIWPEKPEVLGKKVRAAFWGDSEGGIPPGLVGELQISFSYLGVIIGALVYGWLLYLLTQHYFAMLKNSKAVVFVSVMVPYLSFNLVRGGLDVGFTRIVIFCFLIFTLVLLYKALGRKKVIWK